MLQRPIFLKNIFSFKLYVCFSTYACVHVNLNIWMQVPMEA